MSLPDQFYEVEKNLIGSIIQRDFIPENLKASDFLNVEYKEIFKLFESIKKDNINNNISQGIFANPDLKDNLKQTILNIHKESIITNSNEQLINILLKRNEEKKKLEIINENKNNPDEILKQLNKLNERPSRTTKIINIPNTREDCIKYANTKVDGIRYEEFFHNEIKVPSGAMTIISGQTSHGKTATMLNMSSIDLYNERKVLFINLEENQYEILAKQFLIYYKKDSIKSTREILSIFENGDLTNEYSEENIKEFWDMVENKNLIRVIYGHFTISEIERLINDARIYGYESVYIDYIQKIRPDENSKYTLRQLELADISGRLTNTAVKANIRLIVGAQLQRSEAQKKETKRLPFTDGAIREAGDIGNDANLIICMQKEGNKIYFNTAKNRDGNKDLKWICNFSNSRVLTINKDDGWDE